MSEFKKAFGSSVATTSGSLAGKLLVYGVATLLIVGVAYGAYIYFVPYALRHPVGSATKAVETVKDRAADAATKANETVKETTGKDVEEIVQDIKDNGNDAVGYAKEKGGEVKDFAVEKGGEVKQFGQDLWKDLKSKVGSEEVEEQPKQ